MSAKSVTVGGVRAGRLFVLYCAVVLASCDTNPVLTPGRVGCVEFTVPVGYRAASYADGNGQGWKLSQADGGSTHDYFRVWGTNTSVDHADELMSGTLQGWFDEADAGIARPPDLKHDSIDGVPALHLSSIKFHHRPEGEFEEHRTILVLLHDHVGFAASAFYVTGVGQPDPNAALVAGLMSSVRARACKPPFFKRWWKDL